MELLNLKVVSFTLNKRMVFQDTNLSFTPIYQEQERMNNFQLKWSILLAFLSAPINPDEYFGGLMSP